MIIGGIGYLIAFLKRYQWSAFSFNFVLAPFTYQWSLLVQGWGWTHGLVRGPCSMVHAPWISKPFWSWRSAVHRPTGYGARISVQGFIFEDKNTESGEIPTILNGTMPYWEPSQFAFIRINLAAILEAEFSAATCLISFCCILGIASPSQCIIMVLLETVFYKVGFQLNFRKIRKSFSCHMEWITSPTHDCRPIKEH